MKYLLNLYVVLGIICISLTMTSPKRLRMTSESDILEVAKEAAKLAGSNMKKKLGQAVVEKTKSSKDDLVTLVDKECQNIVESKIKEFFPSHEFLGEEDVLPGSAESAKALETYIEREWLWIVDPIDGTTNFVHGRPSSVVSIACAHKGEVVIGVIYDPYRDELFYARRGKGAFVNETPLSVGREELFEEALLGFGIGTKPSVRLPMLRCVDQFSSKCRGIRLQGSAALELAWVACGRQTGFYELDLNSWDIAAGSLLVSEAGGMVTNSLGEPFSLRTRHVVASNGAEDIHRSMLESIKIADAVDIQK